MSDAPKTGARTAAVTILLIVAGANLAYAAYRTMQGMEGSLPLVIAGVACGTVALAVSAAGRK